MAVMEQAQHMTALAKANRTRLARSAIKNAIAAGETTVADVIEENLPAVQKMTVTALLIAQHQWKYARARAFLEAVALPEAKTVGTLTDRQRRALVAYLRIDGPVSQRDAIHRPCPVCEAPVGTGCWVMIGPHGRRTFAYPTSRPRQEVHPERRDAR